MPPSQAGPSRFSRAAPLRWVFLGFAFAGTVLNYLDRQTLSIAAPVLRRELHFADLEYSRIVAAFLIAYTVGNGISGFVIDRIGTKWGYTLCMVWWSVAGALHGFARSANSLAICRSLLGLGEAGNWPAAIRVVSEWFPARERALASGIFNSGSSIGAVLAPPLIAWILLRFGWHAPFFSIGLLGLLWSVLWIVSYRRSDQTQKLVANSSIPPGALIRERFVWSLTLAKVFFDPVWYFYLFWFPQYLSSARHFSMAQIGVYAWVPFLAADIGNLAGGAISAKLIASGMPVLRARKITLSAFAILMLAGAGVPAVAAVRESIALASLATFGYCGALANMLSLPADCYPTSVLGAIWGVASMGAGFGGMLFTLITGFLIQHWSYTPAFIGYSILPLICLAVLVTISFPAATRAAAKTLAEGSRLTYE